MLARCSHCRSTFFAERFGIQYCPACGVEVFVADPNGAQPERKPPAQEESGVQPPPSVSSPEAGEASAPFPGESSEESSGPESAGAKPSGAESSGAKSSGLESPALGSPAPEPFAHERAEFETPKSHASEAAESPEVSQPSPSARDLEFEGSAKSPASTGASGFAGAFGSSGSGGSEDSSGESGESGKRTEDVEDSEFSKPSEDSLPFFEDRKAEDSEPSVESGQDAQVEQGEAVSGIVERLEGTAKEREGAPGSQSSEKLAQDPPQPDQSQADQPQPAQEGHEQQHWPAPVPAWYEQGKAREAQPKTQLSPWEDPESSGFFRPVFETLSGVLGRPLEFFSQLDWRSAQSAHTWFMLVAVFPSVISAFISQSLRDPAASAKAMEEAIAGLPEENREIARRVAEYFNTASEFSSLGTLLLVPLGYFAFLYISAGISHLVLMALGENRSGWTGTFKAFVYGCTPMAFALLPICGGFIAQIWTLALCVFAVSRAHKTSTGHALVAVILVPALAFCCLSFAGAMSLVMSMGQGG